MAKTRKEIKEWKSALEILVYDMLPFNPHPEPYYLIRVFFQVCLGNPKLLNQFINLVEDEQNKGK
jgi:hypothetical protein